LLGERPPQTLLQDLETGDLPYIRGTLEPDEVCFGPDVKCTPFRKPIFIHHLTVND
jgi:hypothetical protein